MQSVWYVQQSERGIKYPKSSKHIRRLYRKKQNAVKDYLHKVTRWIAASCLSLIHILTGECMIKDNSAAYDGGAIYMYDATAEITAGTISGNRSGAGGGVLGLDSTITLSLIHISLLAIAIASTS